MIRLSDIFDITLGWNYPSADGSILVQDVLTNQSFREVKTQSDRVSVPMYPTDQFAFIAKAGVVVLKQLNRVCNMLFLRHDTLLFKNTVVLTPKTALTEEYVQDISKYITPLLANTVISIENKEEVLVFLNNIKIPNISIVTTD